MIGDGVKFYHLVTLSPRHPLRVNQKRPQTLERKLAQPLALAARHHHRPRVAAALGQREVQGVHVDEHTGGVDDRHRLDALLEHQPRRLGAGRQRIQLGERGVADGVRWTVQDSSFSTTGDFVEAVITPRGTGSAVHVTWTRRGKTLFAKAMIALVVLTRGYLVRRSMLAGVRQIEAGAAGGR